MKRAYFYQNINSYLLYSFISSRTSIYLLISIANNASNIDVYVSFTAGPLHQHCHFLFRFLDQSPGSSTLATTSLEEKATDLYTIDSKNTNTKTWWESENIIVLGEGGSHKHKRENGPSHSETNININVTIVKFTQLCSKSPPTALSNFACDWLALDRDISFGRLTSPNVWCCIPTES